MRIVRKISRKRSYGSVCYEYKRYFVPIPSKARDIVRPWVDHDLKVQVESFQLGFSILVYPEDRLLGLYGMSNRFRFLLRQIEKELGININSRRYSCARMRR